MVIGVSMLGIDFLVVSRFYICLKVQLGKANSSVAHVIGVDLYPVPAKFVPPNVTFEVDDVMKVYTACPLDTKDT